MNKYKLSIDKTVNSTDYVEIRTNLTDKELDALLDKIEKEEIASTNMLVKKLQEQGIQVGDISQSNQAYYVKAEVVEIDEVEEPTVFEFLTELKAQVTEEEFKFILAATDADIKFNRVGFNKRTSPKQYINVCRACCNLLLNIEGRRDN